MADAELVAAQLAVRLGVDDAVGPQHRRRPSAASTPSRVDRGDHGGPLCRVGDEGRGERPLGRPAVERARPSAATRATPSPGRRGRASSRAARRAGTAWRAPACCTSGRRGCCSRAIRRSSEAGDPATGRGDPLDALDRRRRAARQPEPAVGGEAPSGGRSSRRRPRPASQRQPAGGRRGVDERPARRRGARRPAQLHHHAGRGLVVGERVGVDAVGPPASRMGAPAGGR